MLIMATNADGKGDEANDFSLPFATLFHMMTIKLSSSNYLLWKNQILPILETQNLMQYFDGSSSPPSAAVDLQLRMLLNSSLSEEAMEVIVGTESAAAAWKALETKFSVSHDERPTKPYLYPGSAREMSNLQLNLADQYLLSDDRRRDFADICVPLCKASIKGDWKAAKSILQYKRHLVRSSITENCETALHLAASGKSTDFMVELLKMMTKNDLLLQTITGDTALCLAAAAGNVKMAEILVNENEDLLKISNSKGLLPLSVAALYGNHDMVVYLYEKSNNMEGSEWNTSRKEWLLKTCVHSNLFDIALKIIGEHGELGQSEEILGVLAKKPFAFNESKSHSTKESEAMQLLKTIWNCIVERPKDEVDKILRGPGTLINGKLTYSSILFVATEMGNTEFVAELIRQYPGLIWKINQDNQSIFHIAVSHRHEGIYSLLHEIGSMKDLIVRLRDRKQNNILHLAGRNQMKTQSKEENQSKEQLARAAFEMQRELLWFKEVESMVPPHFREERNEDGRTPHEVFTLSHRLLASQDETSIKETAKQCMLVATIIAAIVFPIVFALPGGYNQNTGFPIFLRKGSVLVFVVFDAISFILSSASILLFLSIFTSNCDQQAFLESLPNKLLTGLVMLYLSIVTMMITFSLSFFVLFQEKCCGVAIFIIILALIIGIAFVARQHGVMSAAFRSLRGTKLVFKP